MGLINTIAIGLILNSIYPNTFWWFMLAHGIYFVINCGLAILLGVATDWKK